MIALASRQTRNALLRDVVEFDRLAIQPEAIQSGTHYLGLEHLSGDGTILGPINVAVGDLASAKFRFTSEHVLYGKLRPYLRKVARPNFAGICSTDIIPIRPGPEIDRDYLYHALRSPKMVALAESRSAGANLPRISPTVLGEFEIPLPPLNDQKRIAAILNKASRIRALLGARRTHLRTAERSLFLHMVGSLNPSYETWQEAPVTELAARSENAIRTGPFGSDLLHSEFVSAGVVVLGIDNAVENAFRYTHTRFIDTAKYERLKQYTVLPGDVLVTIMGTTGRSAVVPDDVPISINTKHLACITLDRSIALPQFVSFSIHSEPRVIEQIRKSDKGSIMNGLNLGVIKQLRLRVPPLPDQRRFTAALTKLRSTLNRCHDQEAETEALNLSLTKRAFEATEL